MKRKNLLMLLIISGFAIIFYVLMLIDIANAEENNDNAEISYIVLNEYEHQVNKWDARDFRVEKLIVTAYAPHDNRSGICADGDPTKTSTGTYPERGTVAVNPKVFSYGTEFYIPGYGPGIAEDTGGLIRRSTRKIDVVMDSYEEAMEWGVREMFVVVYE